MTYRCPLLLVAFLFLVVRPGAPSSFLLLLVRHLLLEAMHLLLVASLFLVAMPFAPSQNDDPAKSRTFQAASCA